MSEIEQVIEQMTRGAAGFLESLNDGQRDKATRPFADEETRRTWYYTPTPRAGLPILEMTPPQHQWVRRLLAASLSEAGYNNAAIVLGLEYMVDFMQGFMDRTYGNLEGTRVRDPGNYCVAVFGTPGDESGWSWTIGGHHLSLHYTVRNGRVSPTPAFFGAEPSRAALPGSQTFRLLAAEEDRARDLLMLLDPDQRASAVLSPIAATDVVQMNRPRIEDGALYTIGGPGPGGQALRDLLGLTPELDDKMRYSLTAKGLRASEMTPPQRAALVRLLETYFEHMPVGIAGQYASLLDPERLDGTAFAWAGPAAVGAPHYYRVQGDRLLIEYDCTQDKANHTHTVWRDPLGDFGEDLLAQHYAGAHRA
jgi:hypothetical protein